MVNNKSQTENRIIMVCKDGEMRDLCIGKLTITFWAFLSGVDNNHFVVKAESFYYEGKEVEPEDKKTIFSHSFELNDIQCKFLEKNTYTKDGHGVYWKISDKVLDRVIRDILSLILSFSSLAAAEETNECDTSVLENELFPEWETFTKNLVNKMIQQEKNGKETEIETNT